MVQTEKMTHPFRLFLLTLALFCVGNFGVFGQSTPDATALTSSDLPSIDTFPTPTPIPTYPPTPHRIPSPDPSAAVSPFPAASTALTSIQVTSIPVVRTTPPNPPATWTTLPWMAVPTSTFPATALSSATLRGSPPPASNIPPTLAATTIPAVNAPSSVPQHCQLTFSNKWNDLKVTDYDQWTQRTSAQSQLAEFCGVKLDRITDVYLDSNPSSGDFVLRFTIQQGYPIYTAEALQNLKEQLSTSRLQLSGQTLLSPVAIYWTDNGPCPNDTCLNNGTCDVTLSGDYTCLCDAGHTGSRCQDPWSSASSAGSRDSRLLVLLVLLIIPIAIAVIVGFILGRRRQEKEQLKKAFDLRDVRTIGPKSMLSLPTGGETVGIRNQMYDTRSFAIAFTDTTFSKSSPTPSATSSSSSSSSSANKDDNSDGLF